MDLYRWGQRLKLIVQNMFKHLEKSMYCNQLHQGRVITTQRINDDKSIYKREIKIRISNQAITIEFCSIVKEFKHKMKTT